MTGRLARRERRAPVGMMRKILQSWGGWVLLALVAGGCRSSEAEVRMFCAAGVKLPVEEVAAAFEEREGVRVAIQYGGSGTLLSALKVARRGDVYLAADASYTDLARGEGLMDEVREVARITPVIAVMKGNPKGVRTLEDLKREDVRVALANPEAASIGKQTRRILEEQGSWTEVERAVRENGVFKPTVTELVSDLLVGAVDAAVVWDANVRQHEELELMEVPEFDEETEAVSVGVLTFAEAAEAGRRWVDFLTGEDGADAFRRHGYEVAGR